MNETIHMIKGVSRFCLLQHRHDTVRVDEGIVFENSDETSRATVVGRPLQSHAHFRSIVADTVFKVLLQNIIEFLRLQTDSLLQLSVVCARRSEQEQASDLDVRNEPLARPSLADDATLVEVAQLRFDEQHQEDVFVITVRSLALSVVVDDEGEAVAVDGVVPRALAVHDAFDDLVQVCVERVGEV